MKAVVKRFLNDERGTETVEWAIMIGLIAVASIAIILGIGTWVQNKFSALGSGLNNTAATIGPATPAP